MDNNRIDELLNQAGLICDTAKSSAVALGLESTIEQLTTRTMEQAIYGLQMQFESLSEILAQLGNDISQSKA